MAILSQKMVIFKTSKLKKKKIHNERDQKANESYINVCSKKKEKKVVWGKWANLGLKLMHLHDSGSTPWILFIWPNERGQEVQGNYVDHFPKKQSHVSQMGYFWPPNDKHFCNSGCTLTVFYNFFIIAQ